MAKTKSTAFFCKECGYESSKWMGQCPACREWNSFVEEPVVKAPGNSLASAKLKDSVPVKVRQVDTTSEDRYRSGFGELDRVLGGGIVAGSMVLVGGDPGIGKSTILMQICQKLTDIKILYVSGEESLRQLKLRANRLGVNNNNLLLMTETDVEIVTEQINSIKPDLVMIDSIQTMVLSELSSSAGSITQVRESTNVIMRTAKNLDIPVVVVGHVNKEGSIAGPKVLEHIVDTVLYFEGDKQLSCRILRAVKNRYGSTNEIGVFEMTDKGLTEVENPSQMLLSGRPTNVSGTCVTCSLEGTRPILVEVQGLATQSGYGNPRRMCTGFDYNRLALLIAVLEKRAGYYLSNYDAYVNIVGGFRIYERAADLAICMALVSSLKDEKISDNAIAFGEIGLAGEIRSVTQAQQRINEAVRLGFTKIVIPYHNAKNIDNQGVEVIGVKNIRQAFEALID